MRNKIILGIVILFLALSNTYAQWSKISAIPAQEIVALDSVDDTIFVASRTNLIYKSVDAGASWSPIFVTNLPIEIITLKIFNSKIYIGTFSNGIYTSIDFGVTWVNTGGPLFPISGFDKINGNIYASTMGNGVYIENQITNNWFSFNNSLPINTSYNVYTIIASPTDLIIGAGANGTYYRYDYNNNQWIEDYYYGSLLPGLIIDKIISNSDTLFAVGGNRIIRSNDGGLNWIDDKIASHNGYTRNICKGAHNYYTITNLLAGGTWVQERIINSTVGTTWAVNEEFLLTGYSYDIIEFQNKLYLAKEDGLYMKEIVISADNATNLEDGFKIFPNPANRNNINISSLKKINKISISNSLGQTMFSENILKQDFQIEYDFTKGLYLLTFQFENGNILTKKIIIN